jgi:hypothetical protein
VNRYQQYQQAVHIQPKDALLVSIYRAEPQLKRPIKTKPIVLIRLLAINIFGHRAITTHNVIQVQHYLLVIQTALVGTHRTCTQETLPLINQWQTNCH